MKNEATHPTVTTPTSATGAAAPSGDCKKADGISGFVNTLGRMVEACRLYGLHHPMAVGVMEDAYDLLTTRILPSLNEVHLTLAGNALTVNGTRVEDRKSHAAVLVTTMKEVGVASLRFPSGVSPDEFVKIVLLLTAKIRQTEPTNR